MIIPARSTLKHSSVGQSVGADSRNRIKISKNLNFCSTRANFKRHLRSEGDLRTSITSEIELSKKLSSSGNQMSNYMNGKRRCWT